MKKLLLIIAALFVSFNTFGQETTEITFDGIIYKYIVPTKTSKVIGYSPESTPKKLEIKSEIEVEGKKYAVTKIDDEAFYNLVSLENINIPNSITAIGTIAFYNTSITEITIPNSVTSIGDYVFGNSLETLHCERETPPTIGDNAFGNNPDLKINVPKGCVSKYKTNTYWSAYANNIQGEDPEAPIVFEYEGSMSSFRNWSGLPEDVDNALEVVSALADKDVIIKAAATIAGGDKIEVKSFTIEDGGSIIIEDGGQFIVQEEKEGNVITMQKKINKYNIDNNNIITQGWYSISTPFTEITSHNLKPDDSKHEFFYYDEPSNFWRNYKATGFVITLGKGYIYAQEEEDIYTISITGTPNIADKEITLTAQSDDENLKGFNLIGNPFMHNIKIENIIDDKNIISGDYYKAYYKLSNAGAFNVKYNDGDEIKPLEGILVQANETGQIKICHEHKSSSKRSDKGSICVNVSNKEYSDVAYISFNEGIGLNKIEHRNNEIPMVYVPVDGTDYAVAFMDEDVEEIPVNFEAKKMGEYTISVSTNGRKYNRLTLLDKENNKEINMLAGSYTFLATVNDNPARFILKASLNNNQEAAFYTENNSIIIDNMKGAATVHVYDVMGRPVMKYNTNDSNCQLSTSSLANGVYIIQLMDENGTQVQKVIVNN